MLTANQSPLLKRITLDDLRHLGACYEARRWFSENYPNGLVLPETWELQHQLYVLGHPVLRRWWSACIERGIVPAHPMRGLDLRKVNLRMADLRRTDLRRTDLRGADMRWADLRRASLREADLRGADLRSANLSGADLSSANLRKAALREADLLGTDLRHASLRGVDLRGVDLRGVDLSGVDLSGVRRDPWDDPIYGWWVLDGKLLPSSRR